MNYDAANEMFRLAADLVSQSSRNIFLTGKAGTGKTTFLKYIRENCSKEMAVVAPTGVAAINAGGVTIHSFFQLPLSPFIPEGNQSPYNNNEIVNRNSLISRLRITKEKAKVLRQLELVIIDEISMVRCDTMDAIDTVLRYVRKKPYERFGGVQMLFIGDMFQLSPVIKDQDWKMLSEFYDSPYFFDSTVIRGDAPIYIEFDKIYRQRDEKFIRLLNQVRNNELDEEGMQLLQERYQPSPDTSDSEEYIILTTHNDTARQTNAAGLSRISAPAFTYEAIIEGDFSETAFPADQTLQLKTGAQVMFIKNDRDKNKRFFNGKIGIVTKLTPDKIIVRCKDEASEIEVKPETWQNIRYGVNKATRQMEEEVLGSFVQFPLRLAWAITIHKSQGLTFEKAVIDAGEAFAPGQVYVALSRCTNLSGLTLKSKIRQNSLFTDNKIVEFSRNHVLSEQLSGELDLARKHYREKLLLATFDFSIAANNSKELIDYLKQNKSSFNAATPPWVEDLDGKIAALQATAEKFQVWLRSEFQQPAPEKENTPLRERSGKAASHFLQELDVIIGMLGQSPAVTDSRIHAKEYNDSLKEIFSELSAKRFQLYGFNDKFEPDDWHKRKRSFVLPPFTVNAYGGTAPARSESPHPILHQKLRQCRDSICARKDVPIYMVAGSRSIDEMTQYLPQTSAELRKIVGFGDAKVEQYGKQFLDIINEYCMHNGLTSRANEMAPKKERKTNRSEKKAKVDTKTETYRLFSQGMQVPEIARTRNLAVQTIESHLAHYVSTGDIDIEKLVSHEKRLLIEPAIKDYDGGPITPIKERLGNDVGFGEIRLVLAWQEYQNKETPSAN